MQAPLIFKISVNESSPTNTVLLAYHW